ncbi:hypothetical protein HUJ05_001923 [Dendroctonus ponderosae]|nr:hypothetical protein HUJ05_001923 [Dendroctonus ponderosae]
MSICMAEITAIYEAIKVILKKGLKNVIIFSDSQAAIGKIKNTDLHPLRDYMSIKTRRLLLIANNNGSNIAIAWIPGHSQIEGGDGYPGLTRLFTLPCRDPNTRVRGEGAGGKDHLSYPQRVFH